MTVDITVVRAVAGGVCLVMACVLAYKNRDAWGWFLFAAFLLLCK